MAEPTVDRQVIKACQHGDREAFRLLFEAYKDRVFSIAVYSLGDRAVADDVTQQIFLKLFTAIKQFRGDSEFTTWLYRMVVNACHDERRRTKRMTAWGDAGGQAPYEKKPQERETDRDLFIHSQLFVLVDKQGRLRGSVESYDPKMKPKILAAVKELLREK